jgi:hypothetical protein
MTFIKHAIGRKLFTFRECLLLWHQMQLHGSGKREGIATVWTTVSKLWRALLRLRLVKGTWWPDEDQLNVRLYGEYGRQ